MFTSRSEVTIDRPIDEVYDFLADATNDPRWCPPVRKVELVADNGRTRRYRAVVKPGPRALTNEYDVVELERPRRIAFEGANEMADFEGHYELERDGSGTKVRMVSSLDVHGIMRLLNPVIERMSDKNAAVQTQRLKAILENGDVATSH